MVQRQPPVSESAPASNALLDAAADQLPQEAAECIFIVGVSRSGTSLMRKVLNASDQIAISLENHFLGHVLSQEGARFKFRQFGDLSDDRNAHRLVDYIYSPQFRRGSHFRGSSTQWRWITTKIRKETFLNKVLASDRSERALFRIMMEVYAEHRGRPIMGEKTPIHVRYVPTLMEWFPTGRVIHMLRDPRGNYVSEYRRRMIQPGAPIYRVLRRVPFLLKLFILIQVTLLWRESARLSLLYLKRYPGNYYLQRFEDLVRDPEPQIKRLCDFLGVPFQDRMLKQMVISTGFRQGAPGFDSQAADRWRAHIGPVADRWLRWWFRRYLRQFGYSE